MSLAIAEIIKAAHNQTERKVDQSKLDLRLELALGVQEYLTENRFWFAEKTARFSTQVGVAVYDLSSTAVASVSDLSEVIRMYNVINAPVPTQFSTEDSEIVPIFNRADQIGALENTTNAPPSGWMPAMSGNPNEIRFQAPCDNVYPIRFTYNSTVNAPFEDTAETVPLIPGNLHYGLVIILKKRIFDFLYGQSDPRFIIAQQQYQKFVKDSARRSRSGEAMRTFSTSDAVTAH